MNSVLTLGLLILKHQLVISAERKNEYTSTKNLFKISERAGGDKICLADLLNTYLGVEMDTQGGKSSCGQALPRALMNPVVPLTNQVLPLLEQLTL